MKLPVGYLKLFTKKQIVMCRSKDGKLTRSTFLRDFGCLGFVGICRENIFWRSIVFIFLRLIVFHVNIMQLCRLLFMYSFIFLIHNIFFYAYSILTGSQLLVLCWFYCEIPINSSLCHSWIAIKRYSAPNNSFHFRIMSKIFNSKNAFLNNAYINCLHSLT